MLFILFLSISQLEWIPLFSSISTIAVVIVFILCMAMWLLDVVKEKKIYKKELVCIYLISLILLNNALIVSFNEINLTTWLRSAVFIIIWFLFLYFLRFSKFLRLEFVVVSFILSGFLWIFINLIRTDYSILDVFLNGTRLTYYNQNFILPYPLILSLFILLLIKDSLNKYILLAIAFIVMVSTGYKAHILLFGLALSYYVFTRKMLKVFIFLLIVFPIIFYFVDSWDYIFNRFRGVGGDSDQLRLQEWESALNIFSENPIFGAGLGKEFYIGSGWEGMEVNRSYIHNSLLYLLATLGIFNTSLIIAFLLKLFLAKKRSEVKVILLLLLVSTLSAASYKLIHFNIMLMVIAFLLLNSHKREENGVDYSTK